MKRRAFLKSSAIGLPVMVNGIQLAAMPKPGFFNALNGSDKVLVIIELNGGNDGLNTLIPLDQYDKLANARPNLIIPESSILEIENNNGFHPAFSGMQNLYSNGKMNIIQSVGYPNQNRSHFRSLDIWNTGSASDELLTTGWIGRYLDSQHAEYPEGYPNSECPDPLALRIGNLVHATCQGVNASYSTPVSNTDDLSTIIESAESELDLNSCYGSELQFVRRSIQQTNAYSDSIANAADMGNNLATYPQETLAQQLKTVAKLISGGLQTSIYTVSLGLFDTHANQVVDGNPTSGLHAQLLQTLSDAVSAFQNDLELLGLDNRVVGMTYSEFGRQIKSNNSFGTDHGTAAPLFVFGTCINGAIIGDNYEIPEEVPNQAGVPMQYDFRSVYGSILMDWFDVEENQVKDLLFEDFQHIPIIQNCAVSTDDNIFESSIESYNFPNPFQDWTTIYFKTKGEQIRISIFDTLGHELMVVTDQKFTAGEHRIKIDMSQFPSGNYHYRIASKYAQQTKNLQKIN